MHSTVTIVFGRQRTLELQVDAQPDPAAAEAARDWFDNTWAALGCEPLRPSGKVLLLDKVMGVADTLGYGTLSQDGAKAAEFARQTVQALGKSRITVDLPGLTVGF